jgi:hypothetical protein
MQVDVPSTRRSLSLPLNRHLCQAVCCSVLVFVSAPHKAHAADNLVLIDTQMIAALQIRAQQAAPREQVQLYADLADKISLLVTKEIAEGDEEKAQAALQQLEACTAEIESGLHRDSKGLKRTELLLHMTNRRLADLVRSASGDMKPVVQSALKRLDKAQATLLSAVFEK